MKKRSMLGNFFLTLTAIIWGTAFVAQRAGMEEIEPLTFNAARMVLAAVAIGLLALGMSVRERRNPPVRTEQEAKSYRRSTVVGGICCGLFLTAGSIFQQMGIVYTTAGKAGFVTAMYILFVPIINFLFFRKKNSWLVWTAVAIGVVGMYLLCVNEGFSLTYGDSLVAVCALMFSCHILCCDHFVRLGNPLLISVIQFVTASVISAAAAFLTEQPSWAKLASAAIPILYCGIMSGGIGYTLQLVGQKYTDPTVASLLMSLESVFAVITGALLLHERMLPRELLGCAVMFVAIILVQIPLPQKKKEPENENLAA